MGAPYVKTTWVTGDIVTAAKANNWETQYDDVFDSVNKVFTSAAVSAGLGDKVTVSSQTSIDAYFVACNYTNNNGSESVTTSGRGSWRIFMRNASLTQMTIDWRAASAGAGTFTSLVTLSSSGSMTLAGANAGLTLVSQTGAGANWTTFNSAGVLNFYGGGASSQMTLTTGGSLTVAGGFVLSAGHLQIATSGQALFWGSSTTIDAPADAHLRLQNFANTAGVRLKFSTDEHLQIRTRSDGDDADVYARNINLSAGIVATAVCRADGGFRTGGHVGIDWNGDPNSLSNMMFFGGILTNVT